MPIIWRFLLDQYLRVFLLCTTAFIAVLFTMRLEEIARFVTLGASFSIVIGFMLHQIPYILPIAIPISCLISATLLIQKLSHTHELTALRSCGMALHDILKPILLAAACLTVINFYIVSEMATHSHLNAGMLKSELRSVNPLLLAHNKHLMELKGFYFNAFGSSHMGESAEDVVLAMPNKSNNRLNLLIARSMESAPEVFHGNDITVLTSMQDKNQEDYDSLMLENIEQASVSLRDFSQMVQKKVWTVNNDHLRMPLLLARIEVENRSLEEAQKKGSPEADIKQIQRNMNRGYSEIMRRLSVAIAVFTFSLMGAAFGVNIGRGRSHRGLYYVVGLSALYLIAYFAAKAMDHVVITASLLYFVPHILIVCLSIWVLRRANCGIE